jgi:hypothetical protein
MNNELYRRIGSPLNGVDGGSVRQRRKKNNGMQTSNALTKGAVSTLVYRNPKSYLSFVETRGTKKYTAGFVLSAIKARPKWVNERDCAWTINLIAYTGNGISRRSSKVVGNVATATARSGIINMQRLSRLDTDGRVSSVVF